MARLLGVSPQGFRASILPHLPDNATRDERPRGKRPLKVVHGPTAIQVWAQRKFRPTVDAGGSAPQASSAVQEDLLLERRYRLARAEREELELSVRRGQLVDLDEFLAWYASDVVAPIRKALGRLQITHGKSAVELVTEGIARAEAALAQRSKAGG